MTTQLDLFSFTDEVPKKNMTMQQKERYYTYLYGMNQGIIYKSEGNRPFSRNYEREETINLLINLNFSRSEAESILLEAETHQGNVIPTVNYDDIF